MIKDSKSYCPLISLNLFELNNISDWSSWTRFNEETCLFGDNKVQTEWVSHMELYTIISKIIYSYHITGLHEESEGCGEFMLIVYLIK